MTATAPRHALVTGSSGFIGSHLVDRLLNDGYTVTVVLRPNSHIYPHHRNQVNIIRGDLNQLTTYLPKTLQTVTDIFHLAGQVRAIKQSEFFESNVTSTQTVLEAAKRHASAIQSVVIMSSLEASGPADTIKGKCASDPGTPVSAYGHSKQAADVVAQSYSDVLPISIIRPPIVYGPRDSALYEFFKLTQKGIAYQIGPTPQYCSIIYIDDLIDITIIISNTHNTSGHVYLVTGPDGPTTMPHIQAKIAETLKIPPPKTVAIPKSLFYVTCQIGGLVQWLTRRLLWVNPTRFDSFSQKFWTIDPHQDAYPSNWVPHYDLETGLAKTANWLKKENRL